MRTETSRSRANLATRALRDALVLVAVLAVLTTVRISGTPSSEDPERSVSPQAGVQAAQSPTPPPVPVIQESLPPEMSELDTSGRDEAFPRTGPRDDSEYRRTIDVRQFRIALPDSAAEGARTLLLEIERLG